MGCVLAMGTSSIKQQGNEIPGKLSPCQQQSLPVRPCSQPALHHGTVIPEPRSTKILSFLSPSQPVFHVGSS